MPVQRDWRWCDRCFVLFFPDGSGQAEGSGGACFHELKGPHTGLRSLNYLVPFDDPSFQEKFGFCIKCNSLMFDGDANKGVCPALSPFGDPTPRPHDATGTRNYCLPRNTHPPGVSAQANWGFCNVCCSLVWNGDP